MGIGPEKEKIHKILEESINRELNDENILKIKFKRNDDLDLDFNNQIDPNEKDKN